jgi:hypothetical protein
MRNRKTQRNPVFILREPPCEPFEDGGGGSLAAAFEERTINFSFLFIFLLIKLLNHP